ncbi:MAG: hypothetical protein A4E42_01022 [Methanoregulaceae archaeon PtaU1.Bin222]|nr:MAG: hypothetical protein A4E42_01022 [Methanoregulaceae archaeon PtaU1.Bin222]
MYSWKSDPCQLACTPPFMMFIIGTGITALPGFSRYRQRLMPFAVATARATAIETARIPFAPKVALFLVPSSRIIR